jgi:Cys-tRNA(Pro)/Cys-tRNA(Cys) deacylase
MFTRAMSYLRQKGIPYEVVNYEHEEKGAEFAATATGYPLERTVKTLVVELGRNSYCLALLPGHRELNLKRLADLFSVKRAAMADIATAERLTGYLVGGISPFATKRRLPSVLESSLFDSGEVLINAGHRGTMLIVAPENIVAVLECKVAPIARN